jgi:hypothetical protein
MTRGFKLVVGISVILGLASCKTSYVSVSVLKPAVITIPAEVKSIALVNRTRPSKRDRGKNILEGIISGEAPFVDRQAADECIKGVANKLQGSPRFTVVIPGGLEMKGSGTRQFPEQLDWGTVEDICQKNNADALAVLEVFDSNNSYSNTNRQAKKKDGDKEINYTEYISSLNIQIEAGWRIYVPSQQRIVDQNIYTDPRSWRNVDNSPKKAQNGLPSLDRAVSDAGYYAGEQYAVRISPLWTRVSRMYYKKGNSDFERATRKVQVNDWKGAAELWKKHVNNSDPKIAGWATYNMALACEMDGDLDAAVDWAKKSYVDFQNKKAKYYMNTLDQRIYEQNRLKEQMGDE